jgi:hypothetical protein
MEEQMGIFYGIPARYVQIWAVWAIMLMQNHRYSDGFSTLFSPFSNTFEAVEERLSRQAQATKGINSLTPAFCPLGATSRCTW